ncbi:MAG: precorrin-6Y C5,15-methyltransferase (decarboxylating) subunit CbiT [Chloroflexi bacterium]|nr:precorrin-6Y C5,15-methyltransferase (decarboxylating) subunit CbiT [Chloroflexota bacterium]
MVRANSPVEVAPAVGRALGLSDDALEQRRPLRGQITKSEVRAVSLYALQLRPDSLVWDIGAGTGSVAVEAARIAHDGCVYAIDKDADSADLLRNNVARYGDGRVSVVIGAAPDALNELPDPDAVFIGGGGAAMPEILDTALRRLRAGGRVVANFAVMERANRTYGALRDAGMSPEMTVISAARGRELPDGALRLEAMNPVFIVWGQKE